MKPDFHDSAGKNSSIILEKRNKPILNVHPLLPPTSEDPKEHPTAQPGEINRHTWLFKPYCVIDGQKVSWGNAMVKIMIKYIPIYILLGIFIKTIYTEQYIVHKYCMEKSTLSHILAKIDSNTIYYLSHLIYALVIMSFVSRPLGFFSNKKSSINIPVFFRLSLIPLHMLVIEVINLLFFKSVILSTDKLGTLLPIYVFIIVNVLFVVVSTIFFVYLLKNLSILPKIEKEKHAILHLLKIVCLIVISILLLVTVLAVLFYSCHLIKIIDLYSYLSKEGIDQVLLKLKNG